MQTNPGAAGLPSSLGQWSRWVGVSLRPWSGHAPLSLILRGLIHLAFCGFLLVLLLRLADGEGLGGSAEERAFVRQLVIPAVIVLAVLLAIALARVVVGGLDLVPRRSVTGVVRSVRDRKVGDFLPRVVQHTVFTRNANNMDRRKRRTEVVLLTEAGERQWTVRNAKTKRSLVVGTRVRLTVSPLVGYVARAEPLEQPADQPGSLT